MNSSDFPQFKGEIREIWGNSLNLGGNWGENRLSPEFGGTSEIGGTLVALTMTISVVLTLMSFTFSQLVTFFFLFIAFQPVARMYRALR